VGVVGSYSRWCTNKIVSEADLVLFVGSHTGSQVTFEWRVPPAGTPVIQIDIDPRELGRNYPTNLTLLGDARVTLQRLIKAVKSLKPVPRTTDWLAWVHQQIGEWHKSVEPMMNSDASPIRPERICKEITDFLPSNGILVACTGHASIWTGTMVELAQPGQNYIRAAGSLGCVPALDKCASRKGQWYAFTETGGFYYHFGELKTAVRMNQSITVVNKTALKQVGRDYAGQRQRNLFNSQII
jgi:acetolactate synthase-1/2/3 large subunit